MTDKHFILIWQDALGVSCGLDAFVSDWAISSIWGDGGECGTAEARIAEITQIWTAAHRSIKDIAKDAGLSQRKLAEKFGIPYRTMENWSSGERTPPEYVSLMLQECLGLVRR